MQFGDTSKGGTVQRNINSISKLVAIDLTPAIYPNKGRGHPASRRDCAKGKGKGE